MGDNLDLHQLHGISAANQQQALARQPCSLQIVEVSSCSLRSATLVTTVALHSVLLLKDVGKCQTGAAQLLNQQREQGLITTGSICR